MNQILSTSNNNYNNNYNKIDTKKIISIFCIAIIIVAIVIITLKTYELYINRKNAVNYASPEISIIKEDEEKEEVTIKATCEDGISYVVYTWNDETENRVNLNGSTTFERIIEMPEGENNNLKVEVVSVNGVSNQKTEEFYLEVDRSKPQIDSMNIVNSKLQVKASDDNGISYLKYKWENQDEVIINADEEDNKTISVAIDIQRGTYELLITVVDISGNEEQMVRLITGVNEPEIAAIKYGNVVHITVKHDKGFKKVEYLINDRIYVYDEKFSEYDKNKTTIEFEFELKEGKNLITVKAYSLEKKSEEDNDTLENYASKVYEGICTYEAQQ